MVGSSLAMLALWSFSTATDGAQLPEFPRPSQEDIWNVVVNEDGAASLLGPGSKLPKAPAAWGSFHDAINSTGWAVLDVHSSPQMDGDTQSYAAGFLEGALTSERISQHLNNMWGIDFKGLQIGKTPDAVRTFIDKNVRWMTQNVQNHGKQDPYWRAVGYMLSQLRGLTDGYNAHRRVGLEPFISEREMLMFTMVDTDMDNIVTALDDKAAFVNEHIKHHLHSKRSRQHGHHGHCSAVVRVAPEQSDIWVAHATWDNYRAMLRMVKYLDMPLPGVAARRIAFSANPANLYSADDFYVIDTGLAVIETTIDNYNKSLWKNVRPDTLMNWARAMVSNRLARSGEEWTELQFRHHSGTCNNQWMVVDRNKFTPGQPLQDGTLWISESMPGHTRRADVTDVLRQQGFWPSYNIPYFQDIWKVGGWGTMQKLHPEEADKYSYTQDMRAQMFQRAYSQGELDQLESLMKVIRYNRPQDPLAAGDACNGISSRCDLNPHQEESYDCFGAVDAKIASWSPDADDLSFIAVASPSHEFSEDQPFSWSLQDPTIDSCKPEHHQGHPETFNFSWHRLPSIWAEEEVLLAARGGRLGSLAAGSLGALLAGGVAFVVVTLVGRSQRQHSRLEHDVYIRVEE